MEQGAVIFMLGATVLLFIPALLYIIRIIRQLIALHKGKPYRSEYCLERIGNLLHVKWTDDEGKEHDKTFNMKPRFDIFYYSKHHPLITEVTVYSYKNMASVGKSSILGDLFFALIWISGIIIIWMIGLIKFNF